MDSVTRMSDAISHPPVIVIPPGEGKIIRAFGAELEVHLTGEQTGGRSMLATTHQPPHSDGPPVHYHEKEDELFFVLEGRMAFLCDGQWKELGPGGVAFAPRLSVHTLKNVGDTPAKVLTYAAPSGFEVFFARCAEEFAKPGGPDRARIIAISAEHGIHYV